MNLNNPFFILPRATLASRIVANLPGRLSPSVPSDDWQGTLCDTTGLHVTLTCPRTGQSIHFLIREWPLAGGMIEILPPETDQPIPPFITSSYLLTEQGAVEALLMQYQQWLRQQQPPADLIGKAATGKACQ